MQTNYSRFFADATVDVLSTFMDAPAEVGPPTEVEGVSEVQEVTVLLGLTGSLEGCFFLEFSKPSALKICEFMNFGEPFEELDDFACATLCELANLAGGRAVTLLNDNGGTLSIAPRGDGPGSSGRSQGQSSAVRKRASETNGAPRHPRGGQGRGAGTVHGGP